MPSQLKRDKDNNLKKFFFNKKVKKKNILSPEAPKLEFLLNLKDDNAFIVFDFRGSVMKKSVFIILLGFMCTPTLYANDVLINVSNDTGSNCANGGAKIESGEDDNGNGVLETAEIDVIRYVCNGADGSSAGISVSSAGTECGAQGGIAVSDGSNTSYVCNGADGKSAMSQISEDTDGHCPNGGIKIEAGVDLSGDGKLVGTEEIKATAYACNGADGTDGKDSITKVSEEPKGTANCPNSTGIKIEVGLDDNGNGVLDEGEVDPKDIYYICNGKNGSQGPQGPKGDQGEPGVNGTDGKDGEQGEKGDQGPKGDQGEQGETGATGEAGKNGATSLVSVINEPKGENCASGGKKIEVGLDKNGNGELDEEEVDPDGVYYVCNGLDAEEAGLTSSSTGCSVDAVDETDNAFGVLFAVISMLFAFVTVRSARS